MAAESMTNPTATPFRFFLLGATGRTGLPFLARVLARGHFVTIFVRDVSKLPLAMADLYLKLGEKAAGEEVPQWVGITNP